MSSIKLIFLNYANQFFWIGAVYESMQNGLILTEPKSY